MGILDGKYTNCLSELCACLQTVRHSTEEIKELFDTSKFPIVIAPAGDTDTYRMYSAGGQKCYLKSKVLSALFKWLDSCGKPIESVELWSRIVFYDYRMVKDVVSVVRIRVATGRSVLAVAPSLVAVEGVSGRLNDNCSSEVWDKLLKRYVNIADIPKDDSYSELLKGYYGRLVHKTIRFLERKEVTWIRMKDGKPTLSLLALNGSSFIDYQYFTGNDDCDRFIEDMICKSESGNVLGKGVSDIYVMGRGGCYSFVSKCGDFSQVVIF